MLVILREHRKTEAQNSGLPTMDRGSNHKIPKKCVTKKSEPVASK